MEEVLFWGNDRAKQLLLEKQPRFISHAVFLYGEKGLGKFRMSLLLACRYLAGEELFFKEGFFDSTEANLIFNNIHPDLKVIDPAGEMIKVSDIREISKTVYISPNQGFSRVYIIKNANRMNVQAQNALLKLLEDPPGQVRFILTAIEKDSLLETIRSRLWAVPIKALDDRDLKNLVISKFPEVHLEELEEVIKKFPGNAGKIFDRLQNGPSESDILIEKLVDAICKNSFYEIQVVLEEIKRNRDLFEQILIEMENIINEALMNGFRFQSQYASRIKKMKTTKELYEISLFLNKVQENWLFHPNFSILQMEMAMVLSGK